MRTVLVTGTAHGMGYEIVRRAVVRGDFVIATMLETENVTSLGMLPNLVTIEMDVADTASVTRAFDEVHGILADRTLDVVVNCAGISPSGALEVEPISTLERVINVNAVGSARVLRSSLPLLRGHKGRVVLFASLWGRVAGPMLSAYCASKHAIEAIVDATRREVHGQDVDIVLIEPGVVRTNMVAGTVVGSKAGADRLSGDDRRLYGDLYDRFARMIERESTGGVSVEDAADVIEAAMFDRRPRTRYRIGRDAKTVIALTNLLPDRVFDSVFRRMLAR